MSLVSSFRLSDFFGVPSGWAVGDPRILYDRLSGRWIATQFSVIDNPSGNDYSRINIAVSQTSDPGGAWYLYYHPYTNAFMDQPWLGVTSDKITIAGHVIETDGSILGEQTRVYNKSQALSGGPVTVSVFPIRIQYSYLRPAQHMGSGNTQVAARIGGAPSQMQIFRYAGVPGQTDVTQTITSVTFSHSVPPFAVTPGGSLDTFGSVFVDAWVDDVGYLWVTATTACIPSGDTTTRACAQIVQINPANNSVVQNIIYGASNQYYFYPAARTDATGNLYVTFSRSSASVNPEARYAGRRGSDPLGSLSPSGLLRVGEIGASGRWGDYFAAARDPSGVGLCVWLASEYSKATVGWGTHIGKTSYSGC